MNVLWQDNVPSVLDASILGASGFAGSLGDGSAPWLASSDGGLFSGQPVLWWDNGADSTTGASSFTPVGGFDPGASSSWIANGVDAFLGGGPTLDGTLLWPQGRETTSSTLLTGAGAGQFELSASDAASSQWLQAVRDFASRSEAWLAEASTLLWTGGTDQAAITLPAVGNAPLASPTGLDNVGVHPFSMLAPQQLVWPDQSPAATLISEPGVVDPASITFPRTLGVPVQSPSGPLPRLGGTP
jgi:hypothetical protein